ncbi:MAG TPA: glycosyltransferase family 2 protein, partial [Bacteroidia bacterium]|nr:glycosyltransferase family 2 protein [Bacteroidia bacterium]
KNIIRLLKLNTSKGGSKKEAITYAVQHAGNEILLTTDGDCIVPDSWIRTFVNAHSLQDVAFVAGPVSFLSGGGIFGSLQALEMMGLVGIAGAGIQSGKPMMCNGANISYTKSAFLKVDGFSSGYQLASGDDTQLLIKISGLKNGKMVFVKNSSALVLGTSVNSLSRLWQQRKRWASKIPVALTPFTVSVAVVAWFAHALLLASLIVSCIQPAGLPFFFVALVCKLGSEFFLLYSVCNQFNNRRLLLLFLPAQPLYWLYVTIIGILAPFGTYNWKGRNTK